MVCDLSMFYSNNPGDVFLGSMFVFGGCSPFSELHVYLLFSFLQPLKFQGCQRHGAIVQPQVNRSEKIHVLKITPPHDGDLEPTPFQQNLPWLLHWSETLKPSLKQCCCWVVVLGFQGMFQTWQVMELSRGYRQENSPGSLSREKVTQWLSWWFRFRSVVAILVACLLITHPTVFIRISCHKKIHHQPSTCPPLKNRVLDQSKRKQVLPDQFSYSASMSACHKCGRWNEALAILAKMKDPRWRFGLVGPSWKAEGRYRILRLFPMGIDCHCERCFGFIQLVCCKWQLFRNLEPKFFFVTWKLRPKSWWKFAPYMFNRIFWTGAGQFFKVNRIWGFLEGWNPGPFC